MCMQALQVFAHLTARKQESEPVAQHQAHPIPMLSVSLPAAQVLTGHLFGCLDSPTMADSQIFLFSQNRETVSQKRQRRTRSLQVS